ncbi:MAG: PaaI family thioesterase [Elusimicrobiota bacterium]
MTCKFRGDCNCQGYEGILHGGVISALLDSAMTHCLFAKNIEAVTGKMNIRFLKQIPFDTEYTLKAEIAGNKSPLYKLKAFLLKKEEVYAKAEAKFIDLKFINKQSVNRAVRQK